MESKLEFNGGKERRVADGLPIFGNFRFGKLSVRRVHAPLRAFHGDKLVLSLQFARVNPVCVCVCVRAP